MAKNLTPAHLRCSIGPSCPSIHELEDGRLLLVGKDGHAESIKLGIHGAMDERAIIIDRELLSGLDSAFRTAEESKSGVDVAEEAKGGSQANVAGSRGMGCQATSTAACEPSSSLRSSSSESGGEASKGKVDFSFIILNILRGYGWSVAVHNDYRMNGKFHTFWLLTHANGRWVKGEGESDEIALTRAQSQIEEAGSADEVSAANTSASLTPKGTE